ncbi:MAG TPA: NAD(P)/FAD-dependent oxidoreductase [Ktedonobacterales bacterium]|nr:NAD(P)/FAD-dependent oxidoreductase [Ktedonobacterales bacterium]
MYDAIIVGARCAGSPTAMLLARKGYRVLLVDRATFPSDIMSTHYIHQTGVARLKRWGLLERLAATGCPPIKQFSLDVGEFKLVGTPPPVDGEADGYGPRRKVLDKLLVDAAVEAGAEMREGFTMQDVLWDGGRVTGVRGHGRGGATVTEQARVVIGADGLHSLVARLVHAPTYHDKPPISCAYYSYWSGVPTDGFEINLRPRRAAWCIPTNEGLTMIGVGWPRSEFSTYRANIEGNYLKTIEMAPSLARRVRAGKREERFIGTSDLPNYFRKPYGLGWALVGDAGYHKDPTTAQGISDAFRDAELLVEALDAGFTNRLPLHDALASYEQERNEASLQMYEYTSQFATLEPPPEMRYLLSALRGNQSEINNFFGTIAGTVSSVEFFAPEHVSRVLQPKAS